MNTAGVMPTGRPQRLLQAAMALWLLLLLLLQLLLQHLLPLHLLPLQHLLRPPR